jgi:hypothetical protein
VFFRTGLPLATHVIFLLAPISNTGLRLVFLTAGFLALVEDLTEVRAEILLVLDIVIGLLAYVEEQSSTVQDCTLKHRTYPMLALAI